MSAVPAPGRACWRVPSPLGAQFFLPFGKPSSSSVGLGCASSLDVTPVARTGDGDNPEGGNMSCKEEARALPLGKEQTLAHWELWMTSADSEGLGESGGGEIFVGIITPNVPIPRVKAPSFLTRALALAWSP